MDSREGWSVVWGLGLEHLAHNSISRIGATADLAAAEGAALASVS